MLTKLYQPCFFYMGRGPPLYEQCLGGYQLIAYKMWTSNGIKNELNRLQFIKHFLPNFPQSIFAEQFYHQSFLPYD